MKYNVLKHSLHGILLGGLLIVNWSVFALTGDTEKPIIVDSTLQSVDMKNNIVTFSGNVVIKQGSIDIKADKVIIIRKNGEQGKEVIEAYGKPATFYQMQDNGKPITGSGEKMRYELANEVIILTGHASLIQLDSRIESDNITYNVKKQLLEASSQSGKRVITVLNPDQLTNEKQKSSSQSATKDQH